MHPRWVYTGWVRTLHQQHVLAICMAMRCMAMRCMAMRCMAMRRLKHEPAGTAEQTKIGARQCTISQILLHLLHIMYAVVALH